VSDYTYQFVKIVSKSIREELDDLQTDVSNLQNDKVSKSGDTMTGILDWTAGRPRVISAGSAYMEGKNSVYTSDKTTTNSTGGAARTIGGFYCRGKDDTNIGVMNVVMGSTGNNYLQLTAQNKKTNGDTVTNYFRVLANKDGTATYDISSTGNFRTALGLGTTDAVTFGALTPASVTTSGSGAGSFYTITVRNEAVMAASGKALQLCASDDSHVVYLRGIRAHAVKRSTASTYVPIYASAFTVQSSRRVKENIKPLSEEEALKLLDIDVISFDYKNEYGKKGQYGVIAEDVIKILPSVVEVAEGYDETKELDGDNPPPSVDYSKFVPFMIKMIQVQDRRIQELESKLSELEVKIGG
jgi:hypothetical protein